MVKKSQAPFNVRNKDYLGNFSSFRSCPQPSKAFKRSSRREALSQVISLSSRVGNDNHFPQNLKMNHDLLSEGGDTKKKKSSTKRVNPQHKTQQQSGFGLDLSFDKFEKKGKTSFPLNKSSNTIKATSLGTFSKPNDASPCSFNIQTQINTVLISQRVRQLYNLRLTSSSKNIEKSSQREYSKYGEIIQAANKVQTLNLIPDGTKSTMNQSNTPKKLTFPQKYPYAIEIGLNLQKNPLISS